MKRLIAGNWKMHGFGASIQEIRRLDEMLTETDAASNDVLICPPATLLSACVEVKGRVLMGGQDCHAARNGAFTGDISAEMLADLGATHCIVGHSERRTACFETDASTKAKAEACGRAGLVPIVCVGEPLDVREAGGAARYVSSQVEGSWPSCPDEVVLAYEPIWAVGTGHVPTRVEIAEMHAMLREMVGEGVRILYGGSVKASNAKEILNVPNVNGALVGGASLKADDFYGIVAA